MFLKRRALGLMAAVVLCGCASGKDTQVVVQCEPQPPSLPDLTGGERLCPEGERRCVRDGTIIRRPPPPKPICSRRPRTPEEAD